MDSGLSKWQWVFKWFIALLLGWFQNKDHAMGTMKCVYIASYATRQALGLRQVLHNGWVFSNCKTRVSVAVDGWMEIVVGRHLMLWHSAYPLLHSRHIAWFSIGPKVSVVEEKSRCRSRIAFSMWWWGNTWTHYLTKGALGPSSSTFRQGAALMNMCLQMTGYFEHCFANLCWYYKIRRGQYYACKWLVVCWICAIVVMKLEGRNNFASIRVCLDSETRKISPDVYRRPYDGSL